MTPAAVLSEALSTIANPSRFTAHAIALDKLGNEVGYDSDKAVRFDLIGAMLRTNAPSDAFGEAARLARLQVGDQGVFQFEETKGHKAVVAMLKRAIRAAEAA